MLFLDPQVSGEAISMEDFMRFWWRRETVFALVSLCLLTGIARAQVPQRTEQTPATRDRASAFLDGKSYDRWLAEDVRWITTDQERADFGKLSTDKQRDEFIDTFWEKRNPTHGAPENKFKEEHYRRIAYSNVHFADSIPGWKTDRGRVYIVYGPPDEVESHLVVVKPDASSFPYEIWRFKYVKAAGKDVTWKFVDQCRCGELRLLFDSMTGERVH
jgi:GWxTD domain-containing protein